LKNAFGHHLQKSTIAPIWKKDFLRPSSFLCGDQGFGFVCRSGVFKSFCKSSTIH